MQLHGITKGLPYNAVIKSVTLRYGMTPLRLICDENGWSIISPFLSLTLKWSCTQTCLLLIIFGVALLIVIIVMFAWKWTPAVSAIYWSAWIISWGQSQQVHVHFHIPGSGLVLHQSCKFRSRDRNLLCISSILRKPIVQLWSSLSPGRALVGLALWAISQFGFWGV